MALSSPGAEITIIDQSQYLPAASNSVPFLLVATASNKSNAAGTGIASATLPSNASKLYQVTSQRDLVNLFGTPFFYKSSANTPIHGYELNEYGLMAAYSLLGTTNRCYILRADIDLVGLVGQTGRPSNQPTNGTLWLNTAPNQWGIFQFNPRGTTDSSRWIYRTPIVVDASEVVDGFPGPNVAAVNDTYAVIPAPNDGAPHERATYFMKVSNEWVKLGSKEWAARWPTLTATSAPTSLVAGDTITFLINGAHTYTVTVPDAPNNTVAGLIAAINAVDDPVLKASLVGNRLNLYSNQFGDNKYIELYGTGTVLPTLFGTDLASAVSFATKKRYYQPEVHYSANASVPAWRAGESFPHPAGSVWIKVGAANRGLSPVMSKMNSTSGAFSSVNTIVASSDQVATLALDATGGQAIPAGSLYMQYGFNGQNELSSMYLHTRLVQGQTEITGTNLLPSFVLNSTLKVQVSIPTSRNLSSTYTVTIAGTTAAAFVSSWGVADIPNTIAKVLSSGAIQLIHTKGGEILLSDTVAGVSNGVIAAAGFNNTPQTKLGPMIGYTVNSAPQAASQLKPDGITFYTNGSGATFNVTSLGDVYTVNSGLGGDGYVVGDQIKILGSSLGGTSPENDLIVTVRAVTSGSVTYVSYYSGTAKINYSTLLSNWVITPYIANEISPTIEPSDGTNWFYSVADQTDIMVNVDGTWRGYRNATYASDGLADAVGVSATDPNGPIVAASAPVTQSDGTDLVYGDLWIDSSDLENYPIIYRWSMDEFGVDGWNKLDTTDQLNSSGVLFADARWGSNGSVDPINDAIPTIKSLLTSDYTDLDCLDASLYPSGMILFNTRRSGYNVKSFKRNYFNSVTFPDVTLPTRRHAWVSVSGLKENGSPYMGRKAQRNIVVQAMKAAISTNTSLREEDTFFNLIAAPNYPELHADMVVLNNDRNNTAYIIGDTPLRLADQATEITAWATNEAGAASSGEDGMVTRDTYLGVFYPSGITTDLTGASVVVPPSHMMLRTFLRNDQVAYPWLAAAGTRRGTIDNATNIGYIDSKSGEFQVIKNRVGIRDVLYTNQINPLAFFTGVGLLNYGNKNTLDTQSSEDRTNVARLTAYIRERLQVAVRPFIFEPNDATTRKEVAGVIESLFIDLVAKRGVTDYLVVVDESNNTPGVIDRNELRCDISFIATKSAEFIYIPVRLLNTGELK